MDLKLKNQKSFSTRMLESVAIHQKKIVVVFCAGVGVFLFLAGVTVWQQKKESKAAEALYQAGADRAKLEKMAADFSGTKASLIAQSDVAAMSLNTKNFDACVVDYEKLYKAAGRKTYYKVLALHGLGTCTRGKGDFKASADYFEKAAKEPHNDASFYSQFEALRSRQLAGDPAVNKDFNAFLESKDLPADLKEKIEERLLWLLLQKSS